ncbi:MAG: hypothetical protein P8R37_01275 [Opitutae bacterium]|nr:hypothetical protein [Opitutae bacterium]
MSDESGEPVPPKLKLSSSSKQPEKSQSARPAIAAPSVNASHPGKTDSSLLETPKAASKQVVRLRATPPPLAQKADLRTSDNTSPKIKETATEPSEKDNPLSSILIIAAILFILAAAAGGIWLLLRSDKPELVEGLETAAPAANPSNPVERAKVTIATVPERNLNEALDPKSAQEPGNEAVAELSHEAIVEPSPANSTSLKESVSKYLQNVHIGGVRMGAQARIMLDGSNYKINDNVDAATGLIFIGIRDQRLLFKDSNGTIYVKSF